MYKSLKYFDWPFFAATLILTLLGLMMVYSTGLSGSGAESRLWLKQILALLLGLFGLGVLLKLDYQSFKKSSTWLYLFSLLLLVAVLLFGVTIRGGRRWFDLGLFNFQPAEFSKLALVLVLARYCQTRAALFQNFRYVLGSLVLVIIPVVLLGLQPDLGSAALLLSIWLGVLLLSPMPRRYFLYLLIIFLLISLLLWQFLLFDYQKDRFSSFVQPSADPLGRGYNIIQSIVAIGSGGLLGQGLARGLQSQLKFLPERQTDFIFASTVEELGMVGGGLVLLLFFFLFYKMIKIIKGARDLFGSYLASGIFFLLLTQTLVNIGMNLGLLPVTGVTLPFLSYGGSSLVITLWLVGILENIAQHSVPVRFG